MTKILMLLILKALQMKNQNFWQSIKRDLLLCRHMVLKDWPLKYLKDLNNLSSKMWFYLAFRAIPKVIILKNLRFRKKLNTSLLCSRNSKEDWNLWNYWNYTRIYNIFGTLPFKSYSIFVTTDLITFDVLEWDRFNFWQKRGRIPSIRIV